MMSATALRILCGMVMPLVAIGAGHAAPDGDAVAAALASAIAAQGDAQVTYGSVTVADDVVIISELVAIQNGRPDRVVSLPSLEFAGIEARASGGFIAERAVFDGGSATDDDAVVSWMTATAEKAIVPSPVEVKAASKLRPFARLQMGGVRIDTPSGDRLAAVDNLIVEIGEVVANVPSRLRIEALGMVVSADAVGGTRRRAMLKALGYAELELDLILDSMIDLHADTWTMDPLIVKIAGVGDLRIEGHFSGVSIGGFAVDSRRKAAQESAKIDRFTLRFDNAGLVERAIDRQASMTGVPREEFVERFVGAIPFMLNFIGNRPFQDKLAVVAVDFLLRPQSLTIESSPASPVSLDEIAKAAMTNRSVLPDLLAVEISAND